ncbi:hypothetical protein M501DRAFT_1001154 [Patellaria atrata CBS 101060]|uniref:C2 NT-type domain-containing protein n=1 Tax=Patellaria atrata CBS 101060 TaxID=1346257 RepID=A0A9P4S1E0_9PEZI|nr:hypothetical protein M501DRAFT_1001154 [Patellaria atrata CBS 101060]
MQAFVPKNRRPKFELHLKIIDLHNVPLVSGTSFIKWHLPHSAAAEHRGRTEKLPIKEHKVVYDYEKRVPIRLTIDKNGLLQESIVHFEVIQEYSAGGRGERIILGHVKLNLAEYVEPSEAEGEDGICRRYLMQDSKINSTLKISIFMKQIEGDRNFVAPPLKTAPVFGGIAGIMTGDQAESDDPGHIPSLSSKSRETGELQDMYRRTLTASWAAQPGELKADECIEDIFAGGDGWGDKYKPYSQPRPEETPIRDDSASFSDSDPRTHRRNRSSDFSRHENHQRSSSRKFNNLPGGVRGRASLEQQAHQLKSDVDGRRQKPAREIDEFDVREDLCGWILPGVK